MSQDEMGSSKADAAKKIHDLEKYIGDLCYKAPEIFPSGQDVQYRVGQILGMWE